jgi:hypothetical protein
MIETLTLSPYYPHSKFVNAGITRTLEFIEPIRWHHPLSDFYEKAQQPEFAPDIELDQKVIDKWKRDPKFHPFIKWAMSTWGTDIVPEILAGFYCDGCKHSNTKKIQLVLYYPELTY